MAIRLTSSGEIQGTQGTRWHVSQNQCQISIRISTVNILKEFMFNSLMIGKTGISWNFLHIYPLIPYPSQQMIRLLPLVSLTPWQAPISALAYKLWLQSPWQSTFHGRLQRFLVTINLLPKKMALHFQQKIHGVILQTTKKYSKQIVNKTGLQRYIKQQPTNKKDMLSWKKTPGISSLPKGDGSSLKVCRVSDATVDGSEIREANQLRLVNSPIIYKVLYIWTGCLGGSSSHHLQGFIHLNWLFGR